LGTRRGRRQADLLRALRAAAPRPGGRRHRGLRRAPHRGLQGSGSGEPGLRRAGAVLVRGHLAVGHVRYSTTGSTTWENAQPTFRTTATGSGIALGHNGNLVNTAELRDEVTTLRNGAGNGR